MGVVTLYGNMNKISHSELVYPMHQSPSKHKKINNISDWKKRMEPERLHCKIQQSYENILNNSNA
jgi:hypothetical protein